MAKKTVKTSRYNIELEFYTRGPVKKIPSVNFSFNTGKEPEGIENKILNDPIYKLFEEAANNLAGLLKEAAYI